MSRENRTCEYYPPSFDENTCKTFTDTSDNEVVIRAERRIATGSRGLIFRAQLVDANEVVAIKLTRLYPTLFPVESRLLSYLNHRNIIRPKNPPITVATAGGYELDELQVLEHLPTDLTGFLSVFRESGLQLGEEYIMCYAYQMLKGIAFMHRAGFAHRALTPAHVLVRPSTGELKLCGLGIAADFRASPPTDGWALPVSPYAAPEALLGSGPHGKAVDLWSCGCVLAELYGATPLFSGRTRAEILACIRQALGTPTMRERRHMRAHAGPPPRAARRCPWTQLLDCDVSPEAGSLLDGLLTYSPMARMTAEAALRHPYFDPLRLRTVALPGGERPVLFDSMLERTRLWQSLEPPEHY